MPASKPRMPIMVAVMMRLPPLAPSTAMRSGPNMKVGLIELSGRRPGAAFAS